MTMTRNEIARRSRWKHRERVLAEKKRYRERHREKVAAMLKSWRLRNLEKVRADERRRSLLRRRPPEWWRAYYLEHKEAYAATRRRYQEKHREEVRTLNAKKRARRLGAPGYHTATEWLEKIELFAGCCAYCGEAGPLQRDHRIPLTRGGSNDISNIVPACRSCNAHKSAMTDAEFIARGRR